MELFNSLFILVVACNFGFVFGGPNLYGEAKQICPKPDSSNLDETAKLKDKACEAKLINLTSLSANINLPKPIPGAENVDVVTGAMLKSFLTENAAADCRVKDCSMLYIENRHHCLASAADHINVGEMAVNIVLGFIGAVCDQEIEDALTSAINETSDVCINKIFNPKLRAQTMAVTKLKNCLDSISAAATANLHGANIEVVLRDHQALLIENCVSTPLRQICGEENVAGFTKFFTKFIPKVFNP